MHAQHVPEFAWNSLIIFDGKSRNASIIILRWVVCMWRENFPIFRKFSLNSSSLKSIFGIVPNFLTHFPGINAFMMWFLWSCVLNTSCFSLIFGWLHFKSRCFSSMFEFLLRIFTKFRSKTRFRLKFALKIILCIECFGIKLDFFEFSRVFLALKLPQLFICHQYSNAAFQL